MGHNLLRAYHQMVGRDLTHDLWPPGAPSASGVAPYKVGFPVLTGATFLTAKYGTTVVDQMSWTMVRGTDVGPLIPHLGPPNLYLPVFLLMSGSKSHFASSQVSVEGEGNNAAVAVAKYVNVNLNCCGPLFSPPLPLGVVITHNTVEVEFTLGDFLAGLTSMGIDAALEFAINWLFFGIGKIPPVQRVVQAAYERFFFRGMAWGLRRVFPIAPGLRGRLGQWLYSKHAIEEALQRGLANQAVLTVASVLGGSPVGYAPPFAPGAGGAGVGEAMDSAHDSVQEYYDTPAAQEYPSSAPDGGPDAGTDGGSLPADAGPDALPDAGTGEDGTTGATDGSGETRPDEGAGGPGDTGYGPPAGEPAGP